MITIKPSKVYILTIMLTNEIVEDHTSNNYHFLLPHRVVWHFVQNLPLHFQYAKRSLNHISNRRMNAIEFFPLGFSVPYLYATQAYDTSHPYMELDNLGDWDTLHRQRSIYLQMMKKINLFSVTYNGNKVIIQINFTLRWMWKEFLVHTQCIV